MYLREANYVISVVTLCKSDIYPLINVNENSISIMEADNEYAADRIFVLVSICCIIKFCLDLSITE